MIPSQDCFIFTGSFSLQEAAGKMNRTNQVNADQDTFRDVWFGLQASYGDLTIAHSVTGIPGKNYFASASASCPVLGSLR